MAEQMEEGMMEMTHLGLQALHAKCGELGIALPDPRQQLRQVQHVLRFHNLPDVCHVSLYLCNVSLCLSQNSQPMLP